MTATARQDRPQTARSRFPDHTPLVEAVLPPPHARGLTAAEIHARVGIGAITTSRNVLLLLTRDGLARSTTEGWPRGFTRRRYWRAPDVLDACDGEGEV